MDAICYSETSIGFQRAAWCHIPEDRTLNLKIMTPLVQVPLVISAVDGILLIVLAIKSVQLTVTRIMYLYVSSYLTCSELRYMEKTADFILKFTVFWDVPPWSLVERSWNVVTVFIPEDGGSGSHRYLRGLFCYAIQCHVKNFVVLVFTTGELQIPHIVHFVNQTKLRIRIEGELLECRP
jgi:hypothetical protein